VNAWSRTALVLLLGTVACSGDTALVESIEPAAAAAILVDDPGAVLVDIRTPDEFAEARIEGAVNIDYYAPDFVTRLAGLDRTTTYVIYCHSGNRSTAALEIFRDLGFDSVHAVAGGIQAWEASGLAVERG
jgi:rhodanese-related sulfurtransferase